MQSSRNTASIASLLPSHTANSQSQIRMIGPVSRPPFDTSSQTSQYSNYAQPPSYSTVLQGRPPPAPMVVPDRALPMLRMPTYPRGVPIATIPYGSSQQQPPQQPSQQQHQSSLPQHQSQRQPHQLSHQAQVFSIPEVLQATTHAEPSVSTSDPVTAAPAAIKPPTETHKQFVDLTRPEEVCLICGKPALCKCSNCFKVFYCGRECQVLVR